MTAPNTNELPSAVLKAEHQVILRVINVLDRLLAQSQQGDGFETDSLARCVEFFRAFADACHHAKEEDLLFPVMETRGIPRDGGPIGCMLEEHRQARALTQQMGEALQAVKEGDGVGQARFHEAARQYIDLLRNHIYKEDNVLFTMGDHLLTPEDQSTLATKFCDVGCRSFHGKKREELEKLADELEARWPTT